MGMARPVHVLRRGSDVTDLVNLSIIAAADAQECARAPQA
jgi:malate dehydrogenase (oxaloacetate-decarboxylating)(NADP+)